MVKNGGMTSIRRQQLVYIRQRKSGDIFTKHTTKNGMKSSQLTLTELPTIAHTVRLLTQLIHLTTQLNFVFTLVRTVPHLRNADVSNCIFARGV